MVSGAVCSFLGFPGILVWDFLNQVMGNWALSLVVLTAGLVVFGVLTVLTSFEILELIPVLSVVIDWLEIFFITPVGQIVFLYLVLSLGIAFNVIPCSSIL